MTPEQQIPSRGVRPGAQTRVTTMPPRDLAPGQCTRVLVLDVDRRQRTLVLETREILLEAPNWTRDGKDLVVNGAGRLWRIPLLSPALVPIEVRQVPPLNNDHVLDPDGDHVFLSGNDGHLYRAPLAGGVAHRVTGDEAPAGIRHYLHGVSADGSTLAFVGLRLDENASERRILSAEIYTVGADGTCYRRLGGGGSPADGPEFDPDGQWVYFNTELFSGHAQIGRMRPDGSQVERLTDAVTVDWFPHLSPDGRRAVYLAYPPGTAGHPADRSVELKVVDVGRWKEPIATVKLRGGQGTINVNSWSPDSRRFAFVAYPVDRVARVPRDGH